MRFSGGVCAGAGVLALSLTLNVLSAETVEAPGIPNFQQVDNRVFRGGQPTDEGWESLAKLGVKTVINLRRDGEDGEHSLAAEGRTVRLAGMRYLSVPMKGAPSGPTDDQIAKVLGVLLSGEPVFVHCKKGKDRTGTVIACYRMAHDGWTSDKALNEAKKYGLHWYEVGMKRYIKAFDPARLRATNSPSPATQTAERQPQ